MGVRIGDGVSNELAALPPYPEAREGLSPSGVSGGGFLDDVFGLLDVPLDAASLSSFLAPLDGGVLYGMATAAFMLAMVSALLCVAFGLRVPLASRLVALVPSILTIALGAFSVFGPTPLLLSAVLAPVIVCAAFSLGTLPGWAVSRLLSLGRSSKPAD
jgi:hypothetical protein